MEARSPNGYSTPQIVLHWIIVLLVLFQFLVHEGMEHSWRAFARGEAASSDDGLMTYLHIASGTMIFLCGLAFLTLRWRRGTPPLPANEPAVFKLVARVTHFLLYALIIVLPLSGSAAWFFGLKPAATVHVLEKTVLLYVVVLHVAGALVQHFVMRSDVLKRMLAQAQ